LKKIILLVLVGYSAWYFIVKENQQPVAISNEPGVVIADRRGLEKAEQAAAIITNDFSCDGRVYCSEMTSRAEAVFFTEHCPDTKMDGDNDGIPCENDTRW